MEALQRKSKTTKFDYTFGYQRSLKFMKGYYIWKPSKKIFKMLLFNLKIFCICLTSSDDPFVEEIYSDNPKIYDVMSWLNFTKKYIWLTFADEKTFR